MAAPRGDVARWSPPLSICITARIQLAGTAKRVDASTMNWANRSMVSECVAICARTLDANVVGAAIWDTIGAMARTKRANDRCGRNRLIGLMDAQV